MTKRLQKVVADADLPVFASHDKDEPMDIHMIRCYDQEANVSVLVNATAYPLSPVTGNKLTPEKDRTVSLSAEEVGDLIEVADCDECGTTHRSEPAFAAELSGQQMYCTICGSEIEAHEIEANDENEDDEDDEVEAADSSGTDDVDWDQVKEALMDSAKDIFGEENVDKSKIDGIMENLYKHKPNDTENAIQTGIGMLRSEEGSKGSKNSNNSKSQNKNNKKSGDDNDTSVASADDLDDFDDEATASDDSEEDSDSSGEENDMNETTASFNLFQSVASNYERLDVLPAGGETQVYYLFADYTPVAVARAENASENVKPLFGNTAHFQNAFHAAAEEGVTNDVMQDFGMEPLVIDIDSSEVVDQQIQAKTQELEEQYENQLNQVEESYQQSLSTAAVGINKGVFKDIDHPLRQALAKELEEVNVRNPHSLIDKVFNEHGEAYARVLISKAKDLMNKNPESREDIARFVDEASYQSNYPVESEGSNLAQRLSSGNRSVPDSSGKETASAYSAHSANYANDGNNRRNQDRKIDTVANLSAEDPGQRVNQLRSTLALSRKQ